MRRRFRRAVHAESERRDHIARDVDDELHTYFALRVQRLIESGLTPDEAAAEAARRFGSLPETREELIRVAATTVNRMRLSDSIHAALYELRYSLRQLRRTPAFSLG